MKTNKNQKQYSVSLAVLVPMNYEAKVIAKNQKEAIKKVIEDFRIGGGELGSINEETALWGDVHEDFDFGDVENFLGINVEESQNN